MRTAPLTAILLLRSTSAFAGVHTYECDLMPLDAGWSVVQNFCDPQEWIEDGQFYQHVEFCPGYDPPQGQQSNYEYSLAEFVGTREFWFEFVVVTDGDSSELIYTAPVSVLFGNNSVLYQLVIADDQVRFIRSLKFPILYFDIMPQVPHTFRIEVFGDELYVAWIDGVQVDAGPPEPDQLTHPVLAEDSIVHFRTKAKFVESTSVWSYIRWGQLQPQGSLDFTLDSAIDLDDFFPYFHDCLTTPSGSWPGCAWADADGNGVVDCADWEAFLDAWTAPEDPPMVVECMCGLADVNDSNAVDAVDLAEVLGDWGKNPGAPTDFNGNGTVNAYDLALLLGAWGPCE